MQFHDAVSPKFFWYDIGRSRNDICLRFLYSLLEKLLELPRRRRSSPSLTGPFEHQVRASSSSIKMVRADPGSHLRTHRHHLHLHTHVHTGITSDARQPTRTRSSHDRFDATPASWT